MRYYQDFSNRDYVLPLEKEERFLYLNKKIRDMREGKYAESARGHEIMLEGEFSRYRVSFAIGDIWYKQTEEWFNNGGIGMPIKIVRIRDDFIYFRRARKIFGIYFSVGSVYTLNKWSFLRIFTSEEKI